MVSFALDTVKFLFIYRYLQNIYWFKRETVITPGGLAFKIGKWRGAIISPGGGVTVVPQGEDGTQ